MTLESHSARQAPGVDRGDPPEIVRVCTGRLALLAGVPHHPLMAILHIRRSRSTSTTNSPEKQPGAQTGRFAVKLPLKMSQPIGLGDAVKRATTALGIKPCGGCQRRAAALNRLITLKPR